MVGSRSLGKLSFLVAGLVIGALMMSPVGAHVGTEIKHLWPDHIAPLVKDDFYTKAQSNARFIKKASTRKGFFSCPSTAWYPEENDDTYWTSGAKRYSTTYPVSVFHCNAVLPHGASVKSVRFSLHDNANPDFVGCGLTRRNLATHAEVTMTAVNTGSASGDTLQTTTAINSPEVDNKKFTYTLECALFGDTENTGFYGASVGYKISAARGAAN